MTQINEQTLLAAGYKQYEGRHMPRLDDCLFQKRVRDSEGVTLYFINIFQYRNLHNDGRGDGFAPEVQFKLDDDGHYFNMELLGYSSIEDVEGMFQTSYDRLVCCPDEN